MRRFLLLLCPPLLAAVLLAATSAPAPSVRGPVLALLSTPVGSSRTTLRFQPVGDAPLTEGSAELTHRPDAVVLGAVLPGSRTVLATALTAPDREVSWASTLYRLDPGQPARALVDRVYCFTRPLVTAEGRVFVLRGKAGPPPTEEQVGRGELRQDSLALDEVNPQTGATRTLYATQGYIAFLAGAVDLELVVYRVDSSGAELLAVHTQTGAARLLARVPPFARDFSVDPVTRQLFFTQLSADAQSWQVESLNLRTGAREIRASHREGGVSAHTWPGAALAMQGEDPGTLTVLGGANPRTVRRGPGVDLILGFSRDFAWGFGLHQVEGTLAEPFALRTSTLEAAAVSFPSGERVDIAGAVDEGPVR